MNNPRFNKKGTKRILKVLQTQLNTQRISSSIETTERLNNQVVIPASSFTIHQRNSPNRQNPFRDSSTKFKFHSLSPNEKPDRYSINKTNFTIKQKKFTTLSVSQSKKSRKFSVSRQQLNNPYLSSLKRSKPQQEDKKVNSIIIDSRRKSGILRKSNEKGKQQSNEKKTLSTEKYKKFHTRLDSIRQQSQSSFHGFYDSIQCARNLTDNGQNRKALLLLKTIQQNFANGSTKKLSCQTIQARNSITIELQILYLKMFNWYVLEQWEKTLQSCKHFIIKIKQLTSRKSQRQQQWKYFYVKTVVIFLICISSIKVHKFQDSLIYLHYYLNQFNFKINESLASKIDVKKSNSLLQNKKIIAFIWLISGIYHKKCGKINESINCLQNCNILLNQLIISIQVSFPRQQQFHQNLSCRQLQIECLRALQECLYGMQQYQKCIQISQLKLCKIQSISNFQGVENQKRQDRSLSTLQAHMSSLQQKNRMKAEDVVQNFEKVVQLNHSRQIPLGSWMKNLMNILRQQTLIGQNQKYNEHFITQLRIIKSRIQISYNIKDQQLKKVAFNKILNKLLELKSSIFDQSSLLKNQRNNTHNAPKFYFRQNSIERLLLSMMIGKVYYLLSIFDNALVCFDQIANLVRFNTQFVLQASNVEDITYENCLVFILLIKLQQYNYHESARILENRRKNQNNQQKYYQRKHQSALDILQLFVQGTVLIIKRYFDEGTIKLQNLQKIIKIIPINNNEIEIIETVAMINTRFNLIYAFSNFCLKRFQLCQKSLHQQRAMGNLQEQQFVLEYNEELCKGVINFEEKQYDQALKNFTKIHKMNVKKVDPLLSIAITLIQKYLSIKQNQQKKQLQQQIKNVFQETIDLVKKLNNNVSSSIYYHKGIFHSYLHEWRQAIYCVDQAIQKSQENFWKLFYARASILASCNNFPQAINDSSIASSLNPTKPEPYLLRSKCLQIEGQCNQAFQCLQNYLALKPDDKQIHKYAGHLLFENGAFEDAIAAFSHSQIEECQQNYHVFQTRGKTHFLLGHFKQAAKDFQIVYSLDNTVKSALFDAKIMKILYQFHMIHIKEKGKIIETEDQKRKSQGTKIKVYDRVNPSRISIRKDSQPTQQQCTLTYSDIISLIQQAYSQWQFDTYGKIFSAPEQYSIKGLVYFCNGKLEQAKQSFHKSIKKRVERFEERKKAKKNQITQDNLRDQEKDLNLFTSQMYFNISLCYLIEKNVEDALRIAMKCRLSENSPYLNRFKIYIQFLSRKNIQNWLQLPMKEVFPLKSKMTNYFHYFKVKIPKIMFEINKKKNNKKQNNDEFYQFDTKLCVPFPKVEPPEISPTFDTRLLEEFSVLQVDIKPETPWVKHDLQQNCIKFTDNIEEYSQLRLEDTNKSESELIKIDDGSQSHIHNRSYLTILPYQQGKNMQEDNKLILNLPLQTEKKLQKILKKRASMK